MIDFTEKVLEKKKDSTVDALIVLAFLKCAEELTQQINFMVNALNAKEPEVKPVLQMLRDALPTVGKMEYWTIADLCQLHGQNLIEFGKALRKTAGDPGPRQLQEIERRKNDLPRIYRDNFERTGTGPLFSQCLDYCYEKSGLKAAAGEEQQ